MKRSWFVLLTVVMLLVSAFPVLAAGNNIPEQKNLFIVTGRIDGIDLDNKTFTVNVLAGKLNDDPCSGETLEINTTGNTRFLRRNEDGVAEKITIADLVIGQNVSVWAEDETTAIRVTVDATLELIGCE